MSSKAYLVHDVIHQAESKSTATGEWTRRCSCGAGPFVGSSTGSAESWREHVRAAAAEAGEYRLMPVPFIPPTEMRPGVCVDCGHRVQRPVRGKVPNGRAMGGCPRCHGKIRSA